jgi:hypothetical protein
MITHRDTGDENDFRPRNTSSLAMSPTREEVTKTPCKGCKFYQQGDTEAHQQLVMLFCDTCHQDLVTDGHLSEWAADDWHAVDNPSF